MITNIKQEFEDFFIDGFLPRLKEYDLKGDFDITRPFYDAICFRNICYSPDLIPKIICNQHLTRLTDKEILNIISILEFFNKKLKILYNFYDLDPFCKGEYKLTQAVESLNEFLNGQFSFDIYLNKKLLEPVKMLEVEFIEKYKIGHSLKLISVIVHILLDHRTIHRCQSQFLDLKLANPE